MDPPTVPPIVLQRLTLRTLSETDADGPYLQWIPVTWSDTGRSLYTQARARIVELFAENLPRILAGDIPRTPQPAGNPPHRRAELTPATRIDLDEPTTADKLLDLLRAQTFPPHTGAWFDADGKRYHVRVEITEVPPPDPEG